MFSVPIAVARPAPSARSAIAAAAAGQRAALPIPSISRSGTKSHADRRRVISTGAVLLRRSPPTITGRLPIRSARLPQVVLNTVSTAAKVATTTPISVALAPRRPLRYSGSSGITVANPSSATPTTAATRNSARLIPYQRAPASLLHPGALRLPGRCPQPDQHDLPRPRGVGVEQRREREPRVAPAHRFRDEAVGEGRILRQQGTVQVRTVHPAVGGAFPSVFAVVAEARAHAPERARSRPEARPASVVLEPDQRGVRPPDLGPQGADEPPGGRPRVLRPEIEQAHPRQVLTFGRPVVEIGRASCRERVYARCE